MKRENQKDSIKRAAGAARRENQADGVRAGKDLFGLLLDVATSR
jgi:hypothetical protein